MVTDEELLAAVRFAGELGTESYREACRLYRQAVLEWRAGHVRWREEYANRAVHWHLIDLITEAAEAGDGPPDAACGSHKGYNRHRRRDTPVCPRCEVAERVYSRGRRRLQRRARAAQDGQAWQEAA